MYTEPRLLVVDDEAVVCESCRRIFKSQGYEVQTSLDPLEGLKLAEQEDFSLILLDIKMPILDGIKFLQELRRTKKDVPVIMITGYASVPTAASAMRLGAVDYLPKPFTPDEITKAVRQSIGLPQIDIPDSKAISVVEPVSVRPAWKPFSGDYRFMDDAWVQVGDDGSARMGALLSRSEKRNVHQMKLPEVGDTVHAGLPIATLEMKDSSLQSIPSPISGTVVAVNDKVNVEPAWSWDDICQNCWIARVQPVRLAEELSACEIRKVVLLNPKEEVAKQQGEFLTSIGCEVYAAGSEPEVFQILRSQESSVLVLDEEALGRTGPQLVGRINGVFPHVKVVVVASPNAIWEEAYRSRRIFYYAIDPFTEFEITDILNSAFHKTVQVATTKGSALFPLEWIHRIRVRNRFGEAVSLLAEGNLLTKERGLGRRLIEHLLGNYFPTEVKFGAGPVTSAEVVNEAQTSDRLLVLKVDDSGRQSQTFSIEDVTSEIEGRTLMSLLRIQPDADEADHLVFETCRPEALGDYILEQMTESVEPIQSTSETGPSRSPRPVVVPSPLTVLHRIRVSNADGLTASVLVDGDLLFKDKGAGERLLAHFMKKNSPIRVKFGAENVTPMDIIEEARACDRLIVVKTDNPQGVNGFALPKIIGDRDVRADIEFLEVQPDATHAGGYVVKTEGAVPSPLEQVLIDRMSTACIGRELVEPEDETVVQSASVGVAPLTTMHRIRVRNRNGSVVSLLAENELLSKETGLGQTLMAYFEEQAFPLEVRFGSLAITSMDVLQEAQQCDVLLVLRSGPAGQHPKTYSLAELVGDEGMATEMIMLNVQSQPDGHSALASDGSTVGNLAQYLLDTMTR